MSNVCSAVHVLKHVQYCDKNWSNFDRIWHVMSILWFGYLLNYYYLVQIIFFVLHFRQNSIVIFSCLYFSCYFVQYLFRSIFSLPISDTKFHEISFTGQLPIGEVRRAWPPASQRGRQAAESWVAEAREGQGDRRGARAKPFGRWITRSDSLLFAFSHPENSDSTTQIELFLGNCLIRHVLEHLWKS